MTSTLPGLETAEERAWQHFLGAALRLHATLNRELVEAHQLSLNEVRLLLVLNNSPTGSARMGDLADELMALPSKVTRQIHRLETQRLVRRCSSPDDGRGVLATITEEGRNVLGGAMSTYGSGVREHFLRPLSRTQAAALGDGCRRIDSALACDRVPARVGRV